jgi:alpha-1,2-mannosyltransferase
LTDPLPYTYPPVLAAVLSLVAWLPRSIITVAWTLLDLALLMWVVRISYARLLGRAGHRWPVVLAALATLLALTAPVLSVFDLGQVGLVLMALVIADSLSGRTRLPRGVLVGAATAIKLVPALFIAYWAVTARWRAATVAAATTLALWLGVALVRPDVSRVYWTGVVFDPARTGDVADVVNQSMNGLLARIGWSSPFVWATSACIAIVIGLVRARHAHVEGDELAALSLVGLATLLASPVSWIHHAVWIVPVTGVLLGDGSDRRRCIAWAVTVGSFLSYAPLIGRVGVTLPGALAFLTQNAFVLAYWVLLVCLPYRSSAEEARGSTRELGETATRVAAHS